ncbi:MAG: DUF2797 domain-containing protein [Pseudomonadota bacterium]
MYADIEISDLARAWTTRISQTDHTINARYVLSLDTLEVDLEQRLGCGIRLLWHGIRDCTHCGTPTERHYGGEFCYECFTKLARCDLCVVSPDRCHHHLGTCRDESWAAGFCMDRHVVYLAKTSDVKVGISSASRYPRRWVDQGARQAMVLAIAPSRRAAGMLEAYCAQVTQDKTDWRKLVRGHRSNINLLDLREQLMRRMNGFQNLLKQGYVAQPELAELNELEWTGQTGVIDIHHPIEQFSPPNRIQLDAQTSQYQGNLMGVLGHFLLFEDGAFDLSAHRHSAIGCQIFSTKIARPETSSHQASLF